MRVPASKGSPSFDDVREFDFGGSTADSHCLQWQSSTTLPLNPPPVARLANAFVSRAIRGSIAVGLWLICFFAMLLERSQRAPILPSLQTSAPAFLLFVLSATSLVWALRGRKIARWGVLLVFIAAVGFFWANVHFNRYQISGTDWSRGGEPSSMNT